MNARRRPWALRLLGRLLPGRRGVEVVEDVEEGWLERRGASRPAAAFWLWRQILSPHTLRLARLLRRRAVWPESNPGRGGETMGGWMRRLRHAARGLARRPGFSAAIIVTLALAVGANTAIFSVVDGVLLEPLPYPDGERLVFVWGEVEDHPTALLSGPQGAEVADLAVLSDVAQVFGFGETSMVRDALPEPIRTLTVGHTFFGVLGVPPLLGRGFTGEEELKLTNEQIRDPTFERPIQPVVLSHRFWRQRFASDPAVLGSVFSIGGHRHRVVGVMPPGFRLELPAELGEVVPADVWVMSPFDQPSFPRDTRFVRVLARLGEGTSIDDAQAALDRLSAWQRGTFPEDARDGFRMRAVPLRQEVGSTARGPLLILLTTVGLVLLIACANVTTLFLARASERGGETWIRRAIGAGRMELAGTAFAESSILAGCGGIAGLMLAPSLTRVLVALAPPELPRVDAIGIDGSVLLWTFLITVGLALLVGAVPAVRSSRSTAVRGGVQEAGSRFEHGVGRVLVAVEVAMAVILVTGTGLLLRSLGHVFAVDPGFETRGVYAWEANLTTPLHPSWGSRVAYMRAVQEALLSEPSVRAAGVMTPVPFDGADRTEVRLGMEEYAPRIVADFRRSTPGALEALAIEIVTGRGLEWSDLEDFDRLYAVVDARFAELAWPTGTPVGQVVWMVRREYGDGSDVWDDWKRVEVVGVAAPIRGRDLRTDDPPTVYVTYSQNMWGRPAFVARSELPLSAERVRALAGKADPRPLLSAFTSLDSVADLRLGSLRFVLTLIGLFATLGLVVAATGVYGLLAYNVGRRERELHIRAALGADRRRLAVMVIRTGLTLTGAGVLVGWSGAWALTRFLQAFLFGVTPTDPATFLGVAGFLSVVALGACWIPSRRAARADPAAALR